MIEDELISIWQSSPNQERAKFEKSRLMIDVQSSMDQFHRAIRVRDLLEQVAIAIVIPAFSYIAYATPYVLSKIASALVIFWAIYVFFRLRNAKKHKPGVVTETYLGYLHKTREYLLIQKRLLDNIFYWYIAPCFLLVTLFLMGLAGIPGKGKGIVITFIFNVVLAIIIYLLNKRAVRSQFIPQLEKIDQLISVMERP